MNDKIKVIASNWINERLEKGKEEYDDELNVNDGRDWIKEAKEELTDAVVYMAAFELQNEGLLKVINELKNENNALKEDVAVLKNRENALDMSKENTDVLNDVNFLQDELETLDSVVDDVISALSNLVDSINSKQK
jgi:predicted RNase H-like nuclease (RuvC/YqgF family)